ncbi:MAG: chitobiase/beta-hexosaminidase C-terminal domain-containing protein [Muribaculaceae bacterium]|nr:chitobiase/beta-hexosaminidase C-terminal domain-containing protein [Muribaculaceae bacterium]
MKKILTSTFVALLPLLMLAQGWPANYEGVMLQGFYWDSFNDTRWPKLESQVDELAEFFKLVWIPQSANCGGNSMGYDDLYWFTNYNSSFGSEQQLRSMINTFKDKGIGTIADVVVNHRKTINDWVTFPTEVYKGVTYKMESTDICRNDDGGATLTWATQNGKQLSNNNDTGEDWGGMRDLDHKSQNVQNIVKAYVKMLLEDLGYVGFRYDMVKGYSASYTGMYNAHAAPEFSVGEYWDGNQTAVKNWLEGTKVDGAIQSAAFDFPFRYVIRDAVNNNRWTNLGTSTNKGLNMENNYKRYSVTFVENHDTQYRDANNQQDPIRTNIEAANAYMLAMPGTPCIFLKHWQDYKESIKQMIYVRQLAGVSNTSASYNLANSQGANYYVQRTVGNKGVILAAMGNTSYTIPATYVLVVSGNNYRLALSKSTETAWASKPSGTYDGAFNVTLTAVSQTEGAQLVYTLNGSEPTASNGTIVADGSSINISGSTTLKVGLLTGGAVSGVITRHYEIDDTPFVPFEITVFLKDPTVAPNNWSQVNFFSWDDTSSPNGSWPGQTITQTKVINGVKFYYHNYTIKNKDYYVNFVFNQGGSTASSHQTEDVTYVNKTSFFEVTTQTNKYQVADVTDTYLPYLDDGVQGDVNGDGEVSIADVNMLINMILSGTPQPSGDVNGDGEVNIADVNAVIDIILNAA